MPLSLPVLAAPLESLTACISVPFAKYPDIGPLFPSEKIAHVAECDGEQSGCYLRLLLGRFGPEAGHFHLDIASRDALTFSPVINSSVNEIKGLCTQIIGKLFEVRFESKFRLDRKAIGKATLLGMWMTVRLEATGVHSAVAAANIRINDSVYKELRWRPATNYPSSPYIIEILGELGPQAVSTQLFDIIKSRADNGFAQFVAAKTPQSGAEK